MTGRRVDHIALLELRSGIRVRIEEQGDSQAPAVLCIPGWGGSPYLYRHNIPALAEAGFRVVAVALKGHGESDKPLDPGEYTLDAMAAHVIDILDALRIEKASLIGQSMAGPIAAQVALDAPHRVERLVLISPVGYGRVLPVALARVLAPMSMTRPLPALAKRWVFELVIKSMYGDLGVPSQRDVDQYFAQASDPDFVRALHRLIHHFNWSAFDDGRLRLLKAPLLVIRGSSDRIVPVSALDRFQEEVPHAKIVRIPGAGHLASEESPKAVNEALIEYLSVLLTPTQERVSR